MGTLVISQNITLDGVIEDPTGDDGFSRGGWFSRISEEDRQGWAEIESAQAFDAAAELYGRRTYEWLTTRWATREGAWAATASHHAQVRRLGDPEGARLAEHENPAGPHRRRAGQGSSSRWPASSSWSGAASWAPAP